MPDSLSDHRPRNPLLAAIGDALAAAKRWAVEHEDGIVAFVQGMILWSQLQVDLGRMRERFEGTEWEYLLDRVDFMTGIELLALLDREGEDGVERRLETVLGRPEALPTMLAAFEGVDLPVPQRQQLAEGLRYVSRREYAPAVPLLMIPFEGVVSMHAKRAGLIEPHKGSKHRFTAEAGRSGSVGGMEDLLKVDALFDEAFGDFLRIHVYGGEGDAFRHGIATEGYRHRALMVTVALLGWLSAVGPSDRAIEPLRSLLLDSSYVEWQRMVASVVLPGAAAGIAVGTPRHS